MLNIYNYTLKDGICEKLRQNVEILLLKIRDGQENVVNSTFQLCYSTDCPFSFVAPL